MLLKQRLKNHNRFFGKLCCVIGNTKIRRSLWVIRLRSHYCFERLNGFRRTSSAGLAVLCKESLALS